ncbi:putative ABC-type nitrate transporter [Helianthus annuus]|nr:putative ABC-type nitrate transporter [Helianthus annuus]
MIRWFICAGVVSLVVCAFILPLGWNMSYLLSVYGIHLHHTVSIQFFTAHLNHLLEYYMQQNSCLLKASMVVGFQLGYTVLFGSYASFFFGLVPTMAGLTVAAGGWSNNIIVYLISGFNIKSIDAAQIANIVNGCMALSPILGVVSMVGLLVLTLTSTLDLLKPTPCEK